MDARKIFITAGDNFRFRVMSKLIWKPFNKRFETVLSRFRRHRALVEDEAQVANMIEASKERQQAQVEREKMDTERELASGARGTVRSVKSSADQQRKGPHP